MVPKNNRINRENFEKVMKKGGFVNSSLFSLRFTKKLEKSTCFSIVVAKKIAKTAVLRNKIRRRAYSILKKLTRNLESPYFIILFSKKGVETASFEETRTDIESLLKKAKIL